SELETIRALDGKLRRRLPAGVTDLGTAMDDLRGPIYTDEAHTNERGAAAVAAAMYKTLRPRLEALAAQRRSARRGAFEELEIGIGHRRGEAAVEQDPAVQRVHVNERHVARLGALALVDPVDDRGDGPSAERVEHEHRRHLGRELTAGCIAAYHPHAQT